jgi:RNA ligase (TIGR02306 family)
MRTLASIQKIMDIQPIEDADKIEVASILGWKVVIGKGEFRVGDLCIYVEIDSVFPARLEFEFLAKSNYRVKTVRLRGQISQGLCLPLSVLPAPEITHGYCQEVVESKKDIIGFDMTDILGIVKYDPPEVSGQGMIAGYTKGNFPSYVPKTDEIRLQSKPRLLEEIQNIMCYVSVKVDGTSSTFVIKDGEIDVCSRNLSKKDEKSCVYWDIARKYNIVDILKKYDNIAIQGEIAGPGICKNKLGLKERELFVFDVYDIKRGEYYSYHEFITFCNDNKLQIVPIKYHCMCGEKTVEEMIYMSQGTYMNEHGQEGIVVRPLIEQRSKVLRGSRLSFKVINPEYLLKQK